MSTPKTKYITDIEPTYEEMKKFVGGYIEVVESADAKHDIILDEEGKLKGKPINKEATELYLGEEDDDTAAGWDFDVIVGDVMVLSGDARLS
tara:strand:- start:19184 stop:19459 length:276 start_codon:yes stop_codon:yes gene_type:complete